MVIRWAELYLNRAEARYRRGDEPGAWADLNVIRNARYVGFEGHRFYDLKRTGQTIVKSNPATNLPATDYRILPRIPTSEIDGNPNMVQNFGY